MAIRKELELEITPKIVIEKIEAVSKERDQYVIERICLLWRYLHKRHSPAT